MNKQTFLKAVVVVLIIVGIFLIPEVFDGKAKRMAQVIVFVLLILSTVTLERLRRSE